MMTAILALSPALAQAEADTADIFGLHSPFELESLPFRMVGSPQVAKSATSKHTSGQKGSPLASPLSWRTLAPGMDLAELEHTQDGTLRITVLRIDPDLYDFDLYSATWEGGGPLSLKQWGASFQLVAGINAGMFQQDGLTNTGFMRRGTQINNPRLGDRLGSAFVSGPRKAGLPRAAVLDRSQDDWETLLPLYDNVVQNFRLLGPNGSQLWPEHGATHSIAAVGLDAKGHILFLHSRSASTVHRFVSALIASPDLALVTAMYVEGGAQAELMIRLPEFSRIWAGQSPVDLLFAPGAVEIPLPNILGVKTR